MDFSIQIQVHTYLRSEYILVSKRRVDEQLATEFHHVRELEI